MIVYILTLIIALLFAVFLHELGNRKKSALVTNAMHVKKKWNIDYIIAAAPFWFITVFRYNVGTDYTTYTTYYVNLLSDPQNSSDYIFTLIVRITILLNINPHWIIVILGSIFVIAMFKFMYQNSVNIKLSILIFLISGTFNWSLNIMKQMVATAIFLCSIKYIKDRKLLKFLMMILVSIGFHKTAIIYIPLYFLYNYQIKKKRYYLLAILVLYFLSPYIRDYLVNFMIKYNFYADYFYSAYDLRSGSLSLIFVNVFILIIFSFAVYKGNKNLNLWYMIQIIATIFSVLVPIIPNGARIVYMFMPMQIVSVPYFLKLIKNRGIRNAFFCGSIVIYFIFYFYYYVYCNYGSTFPYHII